MTESEILKKVQELKTFGNSNLFETVADVSNTDEIKHTFIITSNETEDKFYYKIAIDSIENGAIIAALLMQKNVKTVLQGLRISSRIKDEHTLFLHYLASR